MPLSKPNTQKKPVQQSKKGESVEDCPLIVNGDTWNRMNQRFDIDEFEALEKKIFDGIDLTNIIQQNKKINRLIFRK